MERRCLFGCLDGKFGKWGSSSAEGKREFLERKSRQKELSRAPGVSADRSSSGSVTFVYLLSACQNACRPPSGGRQAFCVFRGCAWPDGTLYRLRASPRYRARRLAASRRCTRAKVLLPTFLSRKVGLFGYFFFQEKVTYSTPISL